MGHGRHGHQGRSGGRRAHLINASAGAPRTRRPIAARSFSFRRSKPLPGRALWLASTGRSGHDGVEPADGDQRPPSSARARTIPRGSRSVWSWSFGADVGHRIGLVPGSVTLTSSFTLGTDPQPSGMLAPNGGRASSESRERAFCCGIYQQASLAANSIVAASDFRDRRGVEKTPAMLPMDAG